MIADFGMRIADLKKVRKQSSFQSARPHSEIHNRYLRPLSNRPATSIATAIRQMSRTP
jgi:hypothetical protein